MQALFLYFFIFFNIFQIPFFNIFTSNHYLLSECDIMRALSISAGRIAEVRSRSRSCNCILETVVMIESNKLNCANCANKIKNKNNIDN